MRYFRRPARESLYGQYRDFWLRQIVAHTTADQLPVLADAWVAVGIESRRQLWDLDGNGLSARILAAVLQAFGEQVPIDRLYHWLEAGTEEDGIAALSSEEATPIRHWLSAHPQVQKALVAYGWTKVGRAASAGHRLFWQSEERLFRSTRPADWFEWMLEQAASTDDADLAQYCFARAAHAALNQPSGFDITIESVERWVADNQRKWPQARGWLEEAWSVPLDHWEGDQFREKWEHEANQHELRRERRRNIEPYIEAIQTGTAPAELMQHVAYAFDKRYIDIRGETPQARVKDFLGGSAEEAAAAIEGLIATLARTDLPSVEDILKAALEQRQYYLQAPCLLGARLACERDEQAALRWPQDLARHLITFWLSYGMGQPPGWYSKLAAQRPEWVASVLLPYAVVRLRKRPARHVTGLRSLAEDDGHAALARLVLPELLARFPARANETLLRTLNGELLRAALLWLAPSELKQTVEQRLAMKSLDAGQRIAWQVAGLSLDAQRYSSEMVAYVGASQSRAAQLALALERQADTRHGATATPAPTLGRLIELIAPHAAPEFREGAGIVTDADRRRDLVRHFLDRLAAQPTVEATAELDRLRSLPALKRWKTALDAAAFDQQRVARNAGFRHSSIEEVARTLANDAPANPQDLAALVLDHLRDLQERLRGDDTNGLKQFRRDDGRTPEVENECRDVLLGLLRERLERLGVHLEKESQAARDKRADMKAHFIRPPRRFAVPIKVKKEDDEALWSAWRTQLKDLYSTDPAAGGVGIYLVLWFGLRPAASPTGERPATPQRLQEQLTERIEPEDRASLSVMVLDLSLPREP
jgi:hypothetical protein